MCVAFVLSVLLVLLTKLTNCCCKCSCLTKISVMPNEHATDILAPRFTVHSRRSVHFPKQTVCGKFQFVATNEREQFAAAGGANGIITVQ